MSSDSGLENKAGRPQRSLALDALRGLAILLMVLSAQTPRGLGNWMYHANNPQHIPATVANDLPAEVADKIAAEDAVIWTPVEDPWAYDPDWVAMTWVDVVFPMFLFAMGASIPLAITGRMSRDPSVWRQIRLILLRFVSLVGFAIYVQQTLPWLIEQPLTTSGMCLSILAFLVLFAVYTRLPRQTPRSLAVTLRTAGVLGVVLVLGVIHGRTGGEGFTWATHDIIILLLAWSGMVASLLWLLTRGRPRWRWTLGLALALFAHEANLPSEHQLFGLAMWDRVASIFNLPGQLLDLRWGFGGQAQWADLSILYNFGMLSCLWLVLPGMYVGQWMMHNKSDRTAPSSNEMPNVSNFESRWLVVLALALISVFVVFVGLQDVFHRWQVGPLTFRNPYTALLAIPLIGIGVLLVWKNKEGAGGFGLEVRLLLGAAACLTLGLMLAVFPGADGGYFEGGPLKVPGTLSWYALSTGIIGLTLLVLRVMIDRWGWSRPASLLVASGQNPMLAYIGARNLLIPVFLLPLIAMGSSGRLSMDDWMYGHLYDWLGQGYSSWWKLLYGAIKVLLLAITVSVLTRQKIIWRT